ncbi:hypothetical protein [Streptomyces cellostaticus]|nr:hypothetical protein [Streptomyces cellostaticus]
MEDDVRTAPWPQPAGDTPGRHPVQTKLVTGLLQGAVEGVEYTDQ